MDTTTCFSCDQPLQVKKMGRPSRFCSNACRQKAYRKRSKGSLKPGNARRWVRAQGKRPIMPNGRPASSTNPATWSTFAEVQRGAGDGFGVMLGDGLGCYDLDHCFEDGVLQDWAKDVIRTIPERVLFVEKSMSGSGLHIFFHADSQGKGFKRNGVERYTQQRFIRTTLDRVNLSMIIK